MAEKWDFVIADMGKVVTQVCTNCEKVFNQGRYALQLEARNHKSFIGIWPKPACCDQERNFIMLFANEEDARKEAERLIKMMLSGDLSILSNLLDCPKLEFWNSRN